MPLTTRRWRLSLLAIVAASLAVAMLAGDDRDQVTAPFVSRIGARSGLRRSTATAMRREGLMALREVLYASSQSAGARVASQDASASRVAVIAMDTIADRYVAALHVRVNREWNALGNTDVPQGALPRTRIQVVLIGALPPFVAMRFEGPARDASVGRSVIVPRSAGAPCTVIITLRRATPALLAQQLESGDGLLGPCGFVAAFGLPGAGLRAALDSVAWHPAAFATWGEKGAAVDSLRPAWRDLGAPAVRCLAVRDRACLDAWRAAGEDSPVAEERLAVPPDDPAVWDVMRLPWFTTSGPSLGRRERLVLSDLVTASGAARFGSAWRESGSVEELVVRATGEPAELWIAKWLGRDYRTPAISPLPNAREVTWLVLLGGVAALVLLRQPRIWRRAGARA